MQTATVHRTSAISGSFRCDRFFYHGAASLFTALRQPTRDEVRYTPET